MGGRSCTTSGFFGEYVVRTNFLGGDACFVDKAVGSSFGVSGDFSSIYCLSYSSSSSFPFLDSGLKVRVTGKVEGFDLF